MTRTMRLKKIRKLFCFGLGFCVVLSLTINQFRLLMPTFSRFRQGVSHVPIGAHYEDAHEHHDDTTISDELSKRIRVLCWVMTAPFNFRRKADVVKTTWGRRCNVLLFFSTESDDFLHTIRLNVSEGRDHLTAKTMLAFQHVHDHYLHEADWFMKCDDDTYVIVENLRYFLSTKNSSEPIYYGHHFHLKSGTQYHSGGAGYVMSQEALVRFGNRKPGICRKDGGSEDVEIGKCLDLLGVKIGNSTDSLGRSRFHCFPPGSHVNGGFPAWYRRYAVGGVRNGTDNISDYAVSFHYVTPGFMKTFEFFTYHLRPYGIVSGVQAIN